MKAVTLGEPGTVKVVDVPEPRLGAAAAADQLFGERIAAKAVLLPCGS